jgi:hypothetical protein
MGPFLGLIMFRRICMVLMSKFQALPYIRNKLKEPNLKKEVELELIEIYNKFNKNEKVNEEQLKFVADLKQQDVEKSRKKLKNMRWR